MKPQHSGFRRSMTVIAYSKDFGGAVQAMGVRMLRTPEKLHVGLLARAFEEEQRTSGRVRVLDFRRCQAGRGSVPSRSRGCALPARESGRGTVHTVPRLCPSAATLFT